MSEPVISSKDEVSALARGLALVRIVADADTPVSNRELAESTGIPKATVSRLAATLIAAGYLRQAEGSERYSLGPQLLDLGNAYLRHFDFRGQVRRHLAELAEFAGANVHLGVRDGLDILMIDTLQPRTAIILSRTGVGTRMAIATSASGRAYLCSSPTTERESLLGELKKAAGSGWKSLKPRLEQAMHEYAQHGFCTSFGEWHPDIHALGFSLHGPRGEHYAVSCGGPAYKLPASVLIEKVGPRVRQLQEAIAREMGAAATA
ncbi:MAG: IclR family transcriptional regulator [Haliea sp.]|nr:MAG: IclR family transcriptional regulator [Haliea sp.]